MPVSSNATKGTTFPKDRDDVRIDARTNRLPTFNARSFADSHSQVERMPFSFRQRDAAGRP
jgi:hypothetical protein